MTHIKLQAVSKRFLDASRELVVIDRLSWDFPPAAAIAIMGRSGIGKSTLLHLVGGLEKPSDGQVWYDQTELSALPDEKLSQFRGKNIGFVFQFHHLLPEFSALENVAMPLLIRGESQAYCESEARQLIERVGLKDRTSHRPGQLSGGEQQRVALARALVARPGVLLADEPTGNLDLSTAAEIEQLLFEIRREIGCTLIIVTHSEDLARKMDVVLEMHPQALTLRG